MTAPLNEIGSIHPGCMDPHPDVLRPNLRLGDLADGNDLGATGAFIDHSAHKTPVKNLTMKARRTRRSRRW
jgi:hypothetical protein